MVEKKCHRDVTYRDIGKGRELGAEALDDVGFALPVVRERTPLHG